MSSSQTNFDKTFGKEVLQSSNVHVNFGQDFIVTTEDKLRLCMLTHANRLAHRTGWVGPVSIFVTIILVLLTTDFHDGLGIPKATWHAVFIIAAVLTFVWSIVAGIKAFRTSTSVDNIVCELTQASRDQITQDTA